MTKKRTDYTDAVTKGRSDYTDATSDGIYLAQMKYQVGDELYFNSDDGTCCGLVRVVSCLSFPVYVVRHFEEARHICVFERQLSPLTSVGALKAGSP